MAKPCEVLFGGKPENWPEFEHASLAERGLKPNHRMESVTHKLPTNGHNNQTI
jgi:hypothetical protein